MVDVSVIIPNYNHAEYLTQRIDSVLNQTYQNFEIIILDDCSTDRSKEVIAAYSGHPKISHIVLNEKNSGGPFYQWEKGILLASGKYIWIAESDDWCEPSLLEELVIGMEKDNECVLSYCQLACIKGDNEISWRSQHHSLYEMVDSDKFINEYLAVKVSIYNASMALFKRDKFEKISREFIHYKFCGDWFFWIQIARQGKVHISGKVLNYFRKHDKDVSGNAYKSGLNIIEELRVTNWMYLEKLISDKIYNKAFKKQFKAYWKVRKTIDPENSRLIAPVLAKPLSSSVKTFKFLPSAIWNAYRK
jgi:glycosyltransferase involved in cell wall biosynthesis